MTRYASTAALAGQGFNTKAIYTVSDDGTTQVTRKAGSTFFSSTSGSGSRTIQDAFGFYVELPYSWSASSISGAGSNRIYELIIYDRKCTSTEITDVESYLATKYSL